jgi:hypothetical protein
MSVANTLSTKETTMTTTTIKFTKTTEGYATPDGRFTITPWMNRTNSTSRGSGRRNWQITDTSGAEPFVFGSRRSRQPINTRTVETVAEARSVIARVIWIETQ